MASKSSEEILYSCDSGTCFVTRSLPSKESKKTKFKMPVAEKCSHLQGTKTANRTLRGKKVLRIALRKGLTTSILATLILAIMLIIPLLPEVAAASTTNIVVTDPSSGYVRTGVRVNGTIDTANGTYILRWDERLNVTIGNATEYDVYASFTVPHTAGASEGRDVLLELIDNKTGSTAQATFRLYTEYDIDAVVPLPPFQLQEGQETDIWMNVTGGVANTIYVANITVKDPTNTTYWAAVSLTNTTTRGYGDGKVRYPSDFSGGAHTNYPGTYHIAFNDTLATTSFTVGLTSKAEYVRRYLSEAEEKTSEAVIQGSGYDNESVTISIAYYDEASLVPVDGYPKKGNVSDGIVTHKWEIPKNATLATYTVTLTSTDTQKPVNDAQNFTVIEIVVSCQAQNKYDNKSLAGVSVKAHLGALGFFFIDNRTTNGTGWVDFLLDHGSYSFGAYWKEIQVGRLSFRNVTGGATEYVLRIRFHIKCRLARVTIKVTDDEGSLPFINVTLANETYAPEKVPSLQTNYTGIVSTHAFTDTVYRIEARRYGHLFFSESIGNLTKTIGNLSDPFRTTCPTYTLFIHASDSKAHPIQNGTVEVIEWGSGRIAGLGKTDQWGSIRLDCTFGRYKVRIYNLEETAILNETVADVIRNQFYLVLNCRIVNLDLSVRVIDYFGQPISNARIKIERGKLEALNLTTGPDGMVYEEGILGGDYRIPAQISLYVAGKLFRVKPWDLDISGEITFQVDDYVMIGGYPVGSNQLITGVLLTILVFFCALILIRRRRSK